MNPGNKNSDVIICRCRDVTEEDIIEAIRDGYDTIELLKRKTKVATGTCGGRTCLPLVRAILARETGKSPDRIPLPKERSPVVPLPIRFVAGERGNSDDH
ncbi:(2Fe-2S)-binding protein [Candidatus Bipolaricaulota bacterium]|nr:(2Fe-2S)-binding protein [Candidatus Bipolaricaulota bacterium]